MSYFTNVELSKLLNNTQDTHHKRVITAFSPRNLDLIDAATTASNIEIKKGTLEQGSNELGEFCTIHGKFTLTVPNFDLFEVDFILNGVMRVTYKYQRRHKSNQTIFHNIRTEIIKDGTLPPLPTIIAPPPPPPVAVNIIAPPPAPAAPIMTIAPPPRD